MRVPSWLNAGIAAAFVAIWGMNPVTGYGQASPYRGLWVGTASLNAVNEVSIPLDESNVPIAPDPRVPTAAFDQLDIRLILHINGAGQAEVRDLHPFDAVLQQDVGRFDVPVD